MHFLVSFILALLFLGIGACESTAQTSKSQPSIVVTLKSGKVVIRLRPDLAPRHVERAQQLAREGFYDGLKFHRVIAGFMAQTGDPKGNGSGRSKHPNLRAEFSSEPFRRGSVGMARGSSLHSANSQFFICLSEEGCSNFTGQYTLWGEVIEGMELVQRIATGEPPAKPDVMVKVAVGGQVAATVSIPPPASPPAMSVAPAAPIRPLHSKVAEAVDGVRRDPTSSFNCAHLKFAHAAYGDGRPFAQAFPDLDAACRVAEAASAAAEAKRRAEWRPDWGLWATHYLALGFLIGIPMGLAFAGLTGRTSASGFLGAASLAGTSAAAAIGALGAGLVTQHASLLDLGVSYSLMLGEAGMTMVHLPAFGHVNLSDILAGAGAGALGLLLMAGARFADPRSGATNPALASEPSGADEIATRRSYWVSLAVGIALIAGGLAFGPRDFSSQLRTEGQFVVGLGVVSLVIVPLLCAWRTASGGALLAAAALLLSAAFATGQLTVASGLRDGVVIALGIAGIAAALEGWRKTRVGARGLLRATRFSLRWPFATAATAARAAKGLSPEELVAAYHLPEHTGRARAAINQELASRGASPQAANDDWLPEPRRATLGPALATPIAPERYTRFIRNRLRLVGVVRMLGIVGAVTVVGLLLMIPLLSMIVTIGGLVGRKRAGRVLLLRPFNQPQMTSALKTVVRTHLGPLGHVVTLSDRGYRPNFVLAALTRVFEWVTLVIGPILRPSFRIASVKDERTFFKLAGFLIKKWRPSTFGLLCSDQAFNVRTSDHWWKRCIDLLLRSSDLVIMDISRVSNGSAWEIRQLAERGLLESCVFLCQHEHLDAAQATLATLLPSGVAPTVHVFDVGGTFIAGGEALKANLIQRMATSAAAWGTARR